MDNSNDNLMNEDGMEESQQQTQSTQQASQQSNPSVDSHLWGYLQPCSSELTRIDFWRIHPRYTIGRHKEQNEIVLPGFKVSNTHCTITWDGHDKNSSVVVHDLSSNGTFINGHKIGRDKQRVLREGNEIAFGTSIPQPGNPLEDYRFIYRHTAGGPPTTGLYAFYDITQELGKGSFAVVMKAISRATGQWVAVKMIQDSRNVRSPGDQPSRPRTELFMREISILGKLKHPNICELKEVFFQEGTNDINLVLELVEGGDLLDYILKNNGLSEVCAQHITYQLCDALSYIHSKNVAHRDLKPENVLLTKDNPPIVKVADFGLAKFVDSLTMLRTMCGTPSYLAPEVVRQENNEGYDNLVDSWSIGVIVFSMLTNAGPFIEDDNQRDIRTRVSERVVDWQTLANANVSEEAHDFIRQLLEENPRNRMTLTDALYHPWLKSYTPVYDLHRPSEQSSIPSDDFSIISSPPENGSSFRGSVNDGFQNLRIQPSVSGLTNAQPIPGEFPNASVSAGIPRDSSKAAPLQRASHFMMQAAEEGIPIPEPSQEMIAHANAQEAGLGYGIGKGTNKRLHSELSPLPENSVDAVMTGSSVLSGPANVNGDDQGSNSDDELFRGSKATSGKVSHSNGKPAGSPPRKSVRNRGAKDVENDEVPLRRSTRYPQKIARHT